MTRFHTRALAAALFLLAAATTGAAAQTEARAGAIPDTARYTAADVHFVTAMIPHHAQALEMSRLAPARAASPQVKTLAARIINAQEDEIALMQKWLRDRGQAVPEASSAHAMHHGSGHGGAHGAAMPGMLTEAQLRELEAARGATFDRLFLTYMIQHHQGAVSMVRELFATTGAAQDEAVFKLASDVHVDQMTEVARMQRMLASLVFGAAPP